MIETLKRELRLIRTVEAVEYCHCDICKKLIYKRNLRENETDELPQNTEQVIFWTASMWHSDWGNDSPESNRDYAICSPECLMKFFASYKEKSLRQSMGINTLRIEVEHTRTFAYEKGEGL